MKAQTETITNRHFFESNYQAQRELAGRLTVLNGLIGNPHTGVDPILSSHQMETSHRRGRTLRSKAFTNAFRSVGRFGTSLVRQYRDWALERQNVRELQSLSDRTLRDIGVSRGDIASIASGAVSLKQINHERELLAQPKLRIVVDNSISVAEQRPIPNAA